MEPKVRDLMHGPPIVVRAEDALAEALRKMETYAVSHLPVVESTDRLVGILSDRDLLRRGLGGKSLLSRETREKATHTLHVAHLMTTEVVTADPADPVWKAAERMCEKDIHSVVVVEEGKVVGMLTTSDVMRWFSRSHPDPEGWGRILFQD